ncbi:MAG: CBS domain-containing protein [Chloroflexi bacterium]|nr:CBS domain-containing protein [Chloroflexota bacterium]
MSEERALRVEDVMSSSLHSIEGLSTVSDAIAIMRERGINALAVNRRSSDDEPGLLLLPDIAAQVLAPNRSPERVNVYEIMVKPALTLPPRMLVRYAVRLLVRLEASRALVVNSDGDPIAMVTLRDLVLGEDPED